MATAATVAARMGRPDVAERRASATRLGSATTNALSASRRAIIGRAPVSLDCLVRRERREIDEVGDGGAEIDDLRRLGEPHEERPDAAPAAQLLDQLEREVGAVEAGHDEDVGGPGEAREGIALAQEREVERHVGAHLAVVLELGLPRV